jgi:hypothetical protein
VEGKIKKLTQGQTQRVTKRSRENVATLRNGDDQAGTGRSDEGNCEKNWKLQKVVLVLWVRKA